MRKQCNTTVERYESFEDIIQDNTTVKKIYEIVLDRMDREQEKDFFDRHILPCSRICYELTIMRNCDQVNAVISGLLHDFGKYYVSDSEDRHEIVGAEIANKLLTDMDYDNAKIEEICEAIKDHKVWSRKQIPIPSQIISDADAISYLENIDYFEKYLEKQGLTNTEIKATIKEKCEDCITKMSKYGKDFFDSRRK